jgi:hypothetical protein
MFHFQGSEEYKVVTKNDVHLGGDMDRMMYTWNCGSSWLCVSVKLAAPGCLLPLWQQTS